MDRNRERFTVGTEVKVVARRMHALVANARYRVTTLIAGNIMDRRRDRRIFQVFRIAQARKAVARVLSGYDRVTRLARIEIWAIETLLWDA
jgi:hypothetical protein